eukprot:12915154-Prorocentrum_lima.AAC.1
MILSNLRICMCLLRDTSIARGFIMNTGTCTLLTLFLAPIRIQFPDLPHVGGHPPQPAAPRAPAPPPPPQAHR